MPIPDVSPAAPNSCLFTSVSSGSSRLRAISLKENIISENLHGHTKIQICLRIGCNTLKKLCLLNSCISGRRGRRAPGCPRLVTSRLTRMMWGDSIKMNELRSLQYSSTWSRTRPSLYCWIRLIWANKMIVCCLVHDCYAPCTALVYTPGASHLAFLLKHKFAYRCQWQPRRVRPQCQTCEQSEWEVINDLRDVRESSRLSLRISMIHDIEEPEVQKSFP